MVIEPPSSNVFTGGSARTSLLPLRRLGCVTTAHTSWPDFKSFSSDGTAKSDVPKKIILISHRKGVDVDRD